MSIYLALLLLLLLLLLSTVVSIFLPPFLPPHPSSPPTFEPTPLWLCPWVLYTCSLMTLPLLSLVNPLAPPLWSLSVSYFHVSGSILLACLFCWLGSTYRWDHMVFTFYHLAYFAQHNTLQFHLTKKKICHVCFTIFRELFYWSIVTFGYIERNFHSPREILLSSRQK